MKLLVTGASGLLGHKIVQIALSRNHEVYSIYNEHPANLGNPIKLDLTEKRQVSSIISRVKPETIIHTAGYTDVEGCEANQDVAWKTNVEATENLATSSGQNIHITYVSTDYIFDGSKGLYKEEDPPNPINQYGYTKLKGEEAVKQHASHWCIARSSVIYGWGPLHKLNFATWLTTCLENGKEVNVLRDQYVSPTLNTNLASMLIEISENRVAGILHTAGATRINRYEYALNLAEVFRLRKDLVKSAKMYEMRWKAQRPKDSSLNINKAATILRQKPLELIRALQTMQNEKSQHTFT